MSRYRYIVLWTLSRGNRKTGRALTAWVIDCQCLQDARELWLDTPPAFRARDADGNLTHPVGKAVMQSLARMVRAASVGSCVAVACPLLGSGCYAWSGPVAVSGMPSVIRCAIAKGTDRYQLDAAPDALPTASSAALRGVCPEFGDGCQCERCGAVLQRLDTMRDDDVTP